LSLNLSQCFSAFRVLHVLPFSSFATDSCRQLMKVSHAGRGARA
jgi:hypothetical protein